MNLFQISKIFKELLLKNDTKVYFNKVLDTKDNKFILYEVFINDEKYTTLIIERKEGYTYSISDEVVELVYDVYNNSSEVKLINISVKNANEDYEKSLEKMNNILNGIDDNMRKYVVDNINMIKEKLKRKEEKQEKHVNQQIWKKQYLNSRYEKMKQEGFVIHIKKKK